MRPALFATIEGPRGRLEKQYAKEFRVHANYGAENSREGDIQMFACGDLKPEYVKDEDLNVTQYGNAGIVTGIEKVKRGV